MSDSPTHEQLTVSSDGMTVIKRFEAEEFPVPAIAFELSSDRAEPVTVRLRDAVPDGVAVEDLGFHPEYGSEHWTIEDDEVVFQNEIAAESEYTTVYGIRATGTNDVEQFLTEPAIDEVTPTASGAAADETPVRTTDDDVVREAIADDGEIPGPAEEDRDEMTDEDVERLNLVDPNAQGGVDGKRPTDGVGDAGTSATRTVDATGPVDPTEGGVDGSLVSALATELRENAVSADDLKLLRRALGPAGRDDGSVEARLSRVQQDIADLRAYTGALEEFLDENGTGDQLIADLEQQVEEFERGLDELTDRVDGAEAEVDATRDDVAEVKTELDGIDTRLDAVSEEVENVSSGLDDVEASVSELETAVEGPESDLGAVREEPTDGDVDERIRSIEAEIDDLREWQRQIQETLDG